MATDSKDAAQAALRKSGIERGQIYQHYKGGLYSIVDVGIKEDTMEPMVIYCSNLKGTTWIRTLADFTAIVTVGGISNGREIYTDTVSRFQRLTY